eukprot:1177213-Prorocentrum_minimum.AAC.2
MPQLSFTINRVVAGGRPGYVQHPQPLPRPGGGAASQRARDLRRVRGVAAHPGEPEGVYRGSGGGLKGVRREGL